MFLKSIKAVLFSIIFSYQLVGMNPIDISQSTGSEYSNLELRNQELINELQKKDEIIGLLRTELDLTKAKLVNTENAYIIQILQAIDNFYSSRENRGKVDREGIVDMCKDVMLRESGILENLWPRISGMMDEKNKDALIDMGVGEVTPLPKALTDEEFEHYMKEGE